MTYLNITQLRLLRLRSLGKCRMFAHSLASLIMLMLSSNTHAIDILGQNDIQSNSQSEYEIGTSDPFLIFALDQGWLGNSEDEQAQRLTLPLQLRFPPKPDSDRTVSIELFYSLAGPITGSTTGSDSPKSLEGGQFDPLYRISYQLDASNLASSQLVFKLPESVDLTDGTLVRLDIDNCNQCVLGESLSTPNQIDALTPTRVFNGINDVAENGLNIEAKDWILKRFEWSDDNLGTSLVKTGPDPHIISPNLDLDPSNLGGLLLKLSLVADSSGGPISVGAGILEVFHADNQHSFHHKAATIVKLPHTTELEAQGSIELFVPLGHLVHEQPPVALVERIRVDLPEVTGANWRIENSVLVNRLKIEEHAEKIPKLVRVTKPLRSSGLQRLQEIGAKMLGDWPFMTFYLLVCCTVAWRVARVLKSK